MQQTHCLPKLIAATLTATILLLVGATTVSAQAANSPFGQAVMRLNTMRPSIEDDILILVEPSATDTETHFRVIFDHTMGVNATFGNITTSTTSLPAYNQDPANTITAMPTLSATATARATVPCSYNSSITDCVAVDFTIGDLTVGTLYGFYITGGVTTPSAPAQQQHTLMTWNDANSNDTYEINLNEEVDMSKVATRIIADNQVIITGVVPPNL
jgi:hypothetical protein